MLQRDTYILMLTLETTAGSCKILLPSQNKEGVFVNMLYDYISLSFKPPYLPHCLFNQEFLMMIMQQCFLLTQGTNAQELLL